MAELTNYLWFDRDEVAVFLGGPWHGVRRPVPEQPDTYEAYVPGFGNYIYRRRAISIDEHVHLAYAACDLARAQREWLLVVVLKQEALASAALDRLQSLVVKNEKEARDLRAGQDRATRRANERAAKLTRAIAAAENRERDAEARRRARPPDKVRTVSFQDGGD